MFFSGLDIEKVWNMFIAYIKNTGDEIIVVDMIPTREIDITKSTFDNSIFGNIKSYKTSISQKPFLVTEKEMYLCYHYKFNDYIYNIIEKDWKDTLINEFTCPAFIIQADNKKIFMATYREIIILLTPVELNLFNKYGFELTEWNIKLNQVL